MAIVSCPDCKREISDQAPTCVNCGHPFQAQRRQGVWDAVTQARTPINVFALAMMAGASVFGYSATRVEGPESLRAFTYSLHTFLAVVGMFFLTLLFCRSAIYHPNDVDIDPASPTQDRPIIAAGLIGTLLIAYGIYQAFATLSGH